MEYSRFLDNSGFRLYHSFISNIGVLGIIRANYIERIPPVTLRPDMAKQSPFRYFKTSSEIVRIPPRYFMLNRAVALAEWRQLGAS